MKLASTAKALFAGAAILTGACTYSAGAQEPSSVGTAAGPTQPKNIVFILVDDLRFDGMGFLQPELQTPALDRLARGGTYMPNTLVTSSLCSPSRATILTGMTARNHGIVDNNDSSEEGLTFFPAYLQQAGYNTAFIGKWHMGAATDAPRAGFDKWVSFKGQGSYYPDPDAAPGRETTFNVDGEVVPQRGYITDELTDYALNWLEDERDPDRPFMLYLSHKAVHSDPLPAPRHAGQYDDVVFDLPDSAANTPENYEGKPLWVYNQRNTWHGLDFFYNSDMSMQEYLRYYYATLSSVDDSVARILAYLEANDLEDDTLIVFTSDNGYLIGDHGLIDKRNAYQPSVQVPMLVYAPGTVPAGAVNTGRVRNLDFAPTFLSLAEVELPEQFEGENAWPLMSGEISPEQWQPDDFIYEYYWEWTFPMTPGTFAIVRDDLKYIQYYGVYDIEELYNLAEDPEEMNNLIDDPAYLDAKIELRQALFEQLADDEGRHVIPYTQRFSRGSVRRMEGGTRAADFPDRWYVEPNRLDRLDDIFPDSPAKQEAKDRGEPYRSFPVLGEGSNSVEGASEGLE
ncbi:sulfatase family protein [Aurantiacibacter poecillastricola]|uniref:sulfatase family protein n=1 Tax=Aurantiacibacter poecillastricola TaxID=3064385 RepID=UPI00273D65FB|nr:sulfatase [Aurantiacibacter sp. 219JJ12-13]MDP5262932.1 sulfatase [Aurantiacibacter sp. 219JJ12-13]